MRVETESPLEAMFARWFRAGRNRMLAEGHLRYAVDLQPQFQVGRYRLDFALRPSDDWLHQALIHKGLSLQVGIELDGHEFHERTPEQVTYRNQRDRDFSAWGWTILHFSGSEFHRNPMGLVVETLEVGALALDQAKAALLRG